MISAWTISSSTVDQFFSNHVTLVYRKGQTVFPQGSPADVLYWLQRGIVEIHRASRSGTRFILRLAGPGDLIGFADQADEKGEPVLAFGARARTNCEVILVTREHAMKVLETLTADKAARLIATLNHSWSTEVSRLSDFLLGDCRQRLKLVLIDLAKRFGTRDERGTLLVSDLTHQDLSDLVGFSRAMTSRVIGELLRDGVIANIEGRYIVVRGSELAASLGKSADSASYRVPSAPYRISKTATHIPKTAAQSTMPISSSAPSQIDQGVKRRN